MPRHPYLEGEGVGCPKKEENDYRIGLDRILSRLGEGNLKAVGSWKYYTISDAPWYEPLSLFLSYAFSVFLMYSGKIRSG